MLNEMLEFFLDLDEKHEIYTQTSMKKYYCWLADPLQIPTASYFEAYFDAKASVIFLSYNC